jgi:hypothetical protein
MAQVLPNINPSSLYRYRSLEEFAREVSAIESATFWCSAYKKLNDPMEGVYRASKQLRESEKYLETKKLIAGKKANLGICSFSESHRNEIMWAHYADEYKGICIEYRFSSLLTNLSDDISFVRIHYSESAPTVIMKLTPEQMAQNLLSYKNYRWLYEREWRMFGPRGLVNYSLVTCVRRVYLGSRVNLSFQQEIKRRLAPLKIEVKKMSLDKYSMEFGDCD